MKGMSLFRSVLVDTVAKTRTPLSIMLCYCTVLHLHPFFLALSWFSKLLPEFSACLLFKWTSSEQCLLALSTLSGTFSTCKVEAWNVHAFLADVFLSMEKFAFPVERLEFWLVTSPLDWGLLLLTELSNNNWNWTNWNTLSFCLQLLKLRNLYTGLRKYISVAWDFFKDYFLLVEV